MRRIDLINAIINVKDAFNENNIGRIFYSPAGQEVDMTTALEAFRKYSLSYQSFTDAEKKIIDIFELNGLEKAETWASIFNTVKGDRRDEHVRYFRAINYLNEFLSKTIDLLRQDNLEYVNNGKYTTSSAPRNSQAEIISIVLPENSDEISNPKRLINILESVNLLYQTVATLEEEENDKLSVLAIDSGSDKSFDFLGLAKVVSSLKDLFIGVWDRIVFYKEKKLHERLDLISKSLPIIERINSNEKTGKFGKEQAEILRRNVYEGINLFIKSGAILPEFEAHSSYNPRLLMTTEPKLLTSNNVNSSNSENQHFVKRNHNNENNNDSSITQEEKELLSKLLDRESKRTRRKPKE